MLAATAVASPPLALMPFTTSSQAGSLRLDTTTLAPCAAICSQIERPMPRLPPVTTATLPVRSNIISLSPRLQLLFDLNGARANSAISSTCADHRNWSIGGSFCSRYPPSCKRAHRAKVQDH
jgi:hypothetical protein